MAGPESVRGAIVPATSLPGDVDAEAIRNKIPERHRMRGLFFTRCMEATRDQWSALEPKLLKPPSRGVYQSFHEYPTRDYFLIYDAAARATFKDLSGAEAHRRYARDEVRSFSSSLLGRVTWSLLGEPMTALLRYPEIYRVFAKGPTATAQRVDDRRVLIELRNAHFPVEYALGVLEGIVMAFDKSPRITLEDLPAETRLDVRWSL